MSYVWHVRAEGFKGLQRLTYISAYMKVINFKKRSRCPSFSLSDPMRGDFVYCHLGLKPYIHISLYELDKLQG